MNLIQLVIFVFILCSRVVYPAVDQPHSDSNNAATSSQTGENDFYSAARSGNVALVKSYLQQGQPVSSRDVKGNTALVIAAGRGHSDIIKILLAAGADVEEATSEGLFESKPALSWAVSQGRTAAAAVLIQNGANPSVPMKRGVFAGKTPLMWASSQGRTDVVKLLLAAGAEVDYSSDSGSFKVTKTSRYTFNAFYHDSITHNDVTYCPFLSLQGKTPLMWASSQVSPYPCPYL